ncbi:hypothetical protein D9M68_969220 [compost metagenome]
MSGMTEQVANRLMKYSREWGRSSRMNGSLAISLRLILRLAASGWSAGTKRYGGSSTSASPVISLGSA